MKKIMGMIAITFALSVQAATVSWTISNVNGPNGDALAGGSVYVFVVAGTTADTTWVTNLEKKGVDAVTTGMQGVTLKYDMSASSAAAGNYSWNAANGFTLKTNAEMGMEGSKDYTLYAVVFDSTTITKDSQFSVTGLKSAKTNADTVTNNKLFILPTSSMKWYKVEDVPEPTSGLLFLIGASLLALRRKQK